MSWHDIILSGHRRKGDVKKGSKKENGKVVKFSIRITTEEHQEIKQKAEKQNMTASNYIRYLVKKDKIK